MSQERTRRPARKRSPEERLPPATSPAAPVTGVIPGDAPDRDTINDPGGWLAIGLLVMAIAVVAMLATFIWMAA